MNGHVFNYDFSQKKNWRAWAWNRISERVIDKRQAVCLYLPGATDFDRRTARSRGFSDHNLIGVERDGETLTAIRKSGALCIDGDMLNAAVALTEAGRLDVVFADFCCGLGVDSHVFLSSACCQKGAKDVVFALNMLRGREGRIAFDSIRAHAEYLDTSAISTALGISEKHRGLIAIQMFCHLVLVDYAGSLAVNKSHVVKAERIFFGHGRPQFFSYRSGKQIFDSVVFRNPFHEIIRAAFGDAYAEHIYDRIDKNIRRVWWSDPSREKVRRSAVAVMAHRTMRSGGSRA